MVNIRFPQTNSLVRQGHNVYYYCSVLLATRQCIVYSISFNFDHSETLTCPERRKKQRKRKKKKKEETSYLEVYIYICTRSSSILCDNSNYWTALQKKWFGQCQTNITNSLQKQSSRPFQLVYTQQVSEISNVKYLALEGKHFTRFTLLYGCYQLIVFIT